MSFFEELKEEIERQDNEELPEFLEKWETRHEDGEVKYILIQMIFLGTVYFFVFSFLLPLITTGSLSFIDATTSYVGQLLTSGLLGYGTAFIVAKYLWRQNEKKYNAADRIKRRYDAAWDQKGKPARRKK